MKAMFRAIHAYQHNVSGSHWDDVNDANIQGDAATVFESYILLKVSFSYHFIIYYSLIYPYVV
jgi:hypothetical protein